jgi:murein DD-endopeptidase MepM/ murein hydrolase activator NlpD
MPFILGKKLSKNDYCTIDLSANNPNLDYEKTSDPIYLDTFISNELKINNAQYGIGGYAEKRATYKASDNFKSNKNERCIHLGIDIWTAAYTIFYAPLDGVVHSFKNNDLAFDYGGTIILEHERNGQRFHTLYGHLSLKSLEGLKKGMKIKAGSPICQIGNWHENGGWPPHLHFQIINDMQNLEGDYIGACAEKEMDFYLNNCPNPMDLLGIKNV